MEALHNSWYLWAAFSFICWCFQWCECKYQFYSLLDKFLMGFVARTMWCGATNTHHWPFCPLTCTNSSNERRIFSSYLLWSCRFVELFLTHLCDTKIHAAELRLNTKPMKNIWLALFFLWILSSRWPLEFMMNDTCSFANSESKTPAVWKRL